MKVYIAARFSRRHECNALAQTLKQYGHEITARWVQPDTDHILPVGKSEQAADAERQRFALEDFEDVKAADWCISLTETPRNDSRGGRHVEFGMAIALGQRLTVIGPRETVFHHLPQVEHCDNVDQFVQQYLEAKQRLVSADERADPLVGIELKLASVYGLMALNNDDIKWLVDEVKRTRLLIERIDGGA